MRGLLYRLMVASCLCLFALTPVVRASDAPPIKDLSAPPPIKGVQPPEPAPATKDAVVIVDVGKYAGSGVCIAASDGMSAVFTNSHITASRTGPMSVICGGKSYPVVTAHDHPQCDLSILFVRGELPHVAKLAEAEPAQGAKVILYGYDYRGGNNVTRKEGRATTPEGVRFRTTLACVSGDSGGGVFDEHGLLVSVNHGFQGTYQMRGDQVGVRLAILRDFAREKMGDRFPRLAARFGKPAPSGKLACVCADACKCKDGDCPGKCPVAKKPRERFTDIHGRTYEKGDDGYFRAVPGTQAQPMVLPQNCGPTG